MYTIDKKCKIKNLKLKKKLNVVIVAILDVICYLLFIRPCCFLSDTCTYIFDMICWDGFTMSIYSTFSNDDNIQSATKFSCLQQVENELEYDSKAW